MGALYPLGDGNVRDGIDLAFQLLIESSKERKKRQEFYRGRKVVVVIAGKSDKAQKASEFLRKLDRYQRQLEGVAGVQASVFCYSIGRQTDDALLKQIACAHNGAWFSVGPKEDVLHLFNSYNIFLALSHTGSNPVWTGFRKDPYAPGRVATVSKSFHSRAGNGVNAMLLGVVSHDVHLDEIKTSGTSWEEVEEALVERSRKHDSLDMNECQLQVHRNVFANGAICVDAFPIEYADHKRTKCKKRKKSEKRRRHPCIEYEGMYYQTVLDGLPWEDAALKCVQRGGALAQATSLDALAFLASMASPDGTWIAARGNSKGTKLRWLRSNATQIALTEHVVHQSANVSGLCVRLDNRGATSNMETTPCGTLLSYTCVLGHRPWICAFKQRRHWPTLLSSPPHRLSLPRSSGVHSIMDVMTCKVSVALTAPKQLTLAANAKEDVNADALASSILSF